MIRIKLIAKTDRTEPGPTWLLLDRQHNLITVRPYRSRRAYRLPLAAVATMIVQKVCALEAMLADAKDQRHVKPRRAKRFGLL